MKLRFILKANVILLMYFTATVQANVLGSDTQNFVPVDDGLDFITVHSGKILQSGFWNLGLYMNYAKDPLPSFGNDTSNDSVSGLDLNLGFGVFKYLALGLSLPQIINQDIKDPKGQVNLSSNGVTEIRWTLKFKILSNSYLDAAFIYSQNHNLTSDNVFIGTNNDPVRNFELAISKNKRRFTGGLNIGFRWRSESKPLNYGVPIEPLGNQILGSFALSYYNPNIDTRFLTETYGSIMIGRDKQVGDQTTSNLETLFGVKYILADNWALQAGVSHGWYRGLSSPDHRIYIGINLGGESSFLEKKQEFTPKEEHKAQAFFVLKNIQFEYESTKIKNKNISLVIDEIVAYLDKNIAIDKVKITGYTDSLGDPRLNKSLSKDRADKIATLIQNELNRKDLTIITEGRGEADPIADNSNVQGRAENRRVELKFLFKGYDPKSIDTH